jgi:DNA-binding PadR family transcriptional regulator
MITATEALILSLLRDRSEGAYGSQLVYDSDGKLKRGSVYTLLNRLEQAGFVKSKEEPAQDDYALPRTRYKITGAGIRARAEFGAWTGLVPKGAAA